MDRYFKSASPVSDADREQFLLYLDKATEFIDNYVDLTDGHRVLRVSFENDRDGLLQAKGFPINRHRLKGLILDYRAFHANNDPIRFLTTLKRVTKYFQQDEVLNAVKMCREIWNDVNTVPAFKNYLYDEIIEIVFNARHFHVAADRQRDFQVLQGKFNEEALTVTIFLGIQRRFSAIRNIKYMLQPISEGRDEVQLPSKE